MDGRLRAHAALRHLAPPHAAPAPPCFSPRRAAARSEARPHSRAPRRRAAKPEEPPPQIHALAPEEAFAPLITERLILRPLLPHDAEPLHRLINDWEVTRNLAVVPFPYPRAAGRRVDRLHRAATSPPASPTTSPSPAAKATRKCWSACVGLRLDRQAARRARWATGSAAASGATASRPRPPAAWRAGRFANLDIDRIMADVATDNPASAAVLRRIGFRQVGEGMQALPSRAAPSGRCWHFEATRDDVFGMPGADSATRRATSRCCWSPPAR